MEPILKIKNIFKKYGSLEVLKDIQLDIYQGQFVSITGPSGAGKSTLLHIMGALDIPDKGEILFRNQNLFTWTEKEKARWRNLHLGFVFQFHHLLPEFSVLENVCLPAYIAGKPKREVESHAKELLYRLKLGHRMSHKPAELSGGESQRTAVARALINKPDIVLADEPSGNLDSKNAEELHQLFLDIQLEWKQTVIVVTHNHNLALLADRHIMMQDGKIENEILKKNDA